MRGSPGPAVKAAQRKKEREVAPGWVTFERAAKLVRRPVRTIRSWVAADLINVTTFRGDRRVFLDRGAVEYLAEQRRGFAVKGRRK